jgi:hypothetical protein
LDGCVGSQSGVGVVLFYRFFLKLMDGCNQPTSCKLMLLSMLNAKTGAMPYALSIR